MSLGRIGLRSFSRRRLSALRSRALERQQKLADMNRFAFFGVEGSDLALER